MAEWREATGKAWKPEKVDEPIEGLLVKVEEKVGPNESILYRIEQMGGEQISVWGSTVLDIRMAEVKVGDTAPDFTLKGIGGKAHTLSEHRGKKSVVLLFYPLDWTPG